VQQIKMQFDVKLISIFNQIHCLFLPFSRRSRIVSL
jgi:hypothetical protein